MYKGYKIRCRAIIIDEGKLLVVKHKERSQSYVLPGGKMDPGEDPLICVRREIIEELGVEPQGLKLAYVYTWKKDGKQNLDFMFTVTNSKDFLDLKDKKATHAFELFDIRWIFPDSDILVRPTPIFEDFKKGNINSNEIKFISQ